MTRYHIIRDGSVKGSFCTKEEAIDMIKRYRARETHWLKSDYYIIKGEEICLKREEIEQ